MNRFKALTLSSNYFHNVYDFPLSATKWVIDDAAAQEMIDILSEYGFYDNASGFEAKGFNEELMKQFTTDILAPHVNEAIKLLNRGLLVMFNTVVVFPSLASLGEVKVVFPSVEGKLVDVLGYTPDCVSDIEAKVQEITGLSEKEIINTLRITNLCFVALRLKYASRFEIDTRRNMYSKFPHRPSSDISVVRINWDAPTILKGGTHKSLGGGGGGWCLPLHGVRGHWRKLRNGRQVWIRAHERGDKNVVRRTVTNLIPRLN